MKRVGFNRPGHAAGWRWVWLLSGLCCAGLAAAADTLPDVSEVTRRMIARAQAVAGAEQGPQYTYEKRSCHERLDAGGQALQSEEKLYQVRLIAGFPFNRLLKIQGRDLTAEELKREEEKEEHFRRKLTSGAAVQWAARKQGWVTPELLERYQFTVRERVTWQGRPTLVLDFKPRDAKLPAKTFMDKVLNRIAGTLWVDEADADVARISANLTDSVSLGLFGMLGALNRCELSLDRQRMADGVWVNVRQVLLIHARKLTAPLRFRATEQSSDFKPVRAGE
jgi:hypothetical protein